MINSSFVQLIIVVGLGCRRGRRDSCVLSKVFDAIYALLAG